MHDTPASAHAREQPENVPPISAKIVTNLTIFSNSDR
jgi:hypothetical protein